MTAATSPQRVSIDSTHRESQSQRRSESRHHEAPPRSLTVE
jgi:hypothetical protein